jgi:hypothetical protein
MHAKLWIREDLDSKLTKPKASFGTSLYRVVTETTLTIVDGIKTRPASQVATIETDPDKTSTTDMRPITKLASAAPMAKWVF